MRYAHIGPIERSTAESLRDTDTVDELRIAVLAVALNESDPAWAEAYCMSLANHTDPVVRGNAVLGFGHLARIHERLNLPAVAPIVRAALSDKDAHVRGQAEDAADDIESFLGVNVRRVN